VTIGSLIQANASTPTLRSVAEQLLSSVLSVDRSYFYCHPEQTVNDDNKNTFNSLMARFQQGEPLSYLVGEQGFLELNLTVTKDTLIPRPETECLVCIALDELPEDKTLSVVDLGTGSGAIALALAQAKPQWKITATDISPAALKVARENADKHNIQNVEFICTTGSSLALVMSSLLSIQSAPI